MPIPEKELIYVADVELVDYNWREYPQNTENNLYFVEVWNVTLINNGNSSALVLISYSMCDFNDNTIQEFYKSGPSSGRYKWVVHSQSYIIGPNMTRNDYGFSFSYQKPQGTETHLKVRIVETYET